MQQIRNLRQLVCLVAPAHIGPSHSVARSVLNISSSSRPTAAPLASAIHTTCWTASTSSGLQSKRRLYRESYYKRRDHIADDYQLVYRAPMEFTVAGCQHLSTFSLAFTSATVAYKCATGQAIVDMANLQVNIGPLMSDADELVWFGAAFVAFNVALLYACSRFPLRIYRHENRYVAMFEGLVPMKARPYPFVAGELTESFDSWLPWKDTMYSMRRRSVLLLTQYFKTPSELNAMLPAGVSSPPPPGQGGVPRKY